LVLRQHHWWQRIFARLIATRPGGWLVLNVTTRIDPTLLRWTNARFSFGYFIGATLLLLTTTGAKSGQPRTVPLLYFRDGNALVMIASKTGKPTHPAWYHNLKAHPTVEVFGRGVTGTYTAREADSDERERLWARALEVYPGYNTYQERAGERRIPVIVLEKQ
jgi:deazaflavin-dependent oxidoreductase (nitroreductase family)